MSYCTQHMISIRLGGVFEFGTDMDDVRKTISGMVQMMDLQLKLGDACVSGELRGPKGTCVVIAGVFNYWDHQDASVFAAALSLTFATEVMVMSHDLENDSVQCNVFLGGKPMLEMNENPIGRMLRRI